MIIIIGVLLLLDQVARRPQDGGDGFGVVGGEGKGRGGDSGGDGNDLDGNDYKNHNEDFHQTGFSQARSVLPAVLNVLDKHNIDGCNKVVMMMMTITMVMMTMMMI